MDPGMEERCWERQRNLTLLHSSGMDLGWEQTLILGNMLDFQCVLIEELNYSLEPWLTQRYLYPSLYPSESQSPLVTLPPHTHPAAYSRLSKIHRPVQSSETSLLKLQHLSAHASLFLEGEIHLNVALMAIMDMSSHRTSFVYGLVCPVTDRLCISHLKLFSFNFYI